MKEFKVNEYITLKLENRKTFIYIKEKKFLQCIRLFLNIPKEKISDYDQINSIDEATEIYDKYLYENKIIKEDNSIQYIDNNPQITPEQEFWGHCSNLQAWTENNYDTRLLRSNLAFPLLKRLTEVGDAKANRVFREEIVKRFIQGNETVQTYLDKENYLTYLGSDEFKILVPELIEREDINGLELSLFSEHRPNRIPKAKVIDLLFDSNYEFKNGNDGLLKQYISLGILIHEILNEEYLEDFTRQELVKSFKDFNFQNLLIWKSRVLYDWLKKVIELGITRARIFFKNCVHSLIKNREYDEILFLLEESYLKILEKDELNGLFENFEYHSFLEQYITNKLGRLGLFVSLGLEKAEELFNKEVKHKFIHGRLDQIISLFNRKFYEFLSKNQLEKLLTEFPFERIHESSLYSIALSIFREIAKINKPLGKKHLRRKIESMFKGANSYDLNSIFNEEYLTDFFNYEEQIEILRKLDLKILKKYSPQRILYLLKILVGYLPELIQNFCKEIIKIDSLHDDPRLIKRLIEKNYLIEFSKQELDKNSKNLKEEGGALEELRDCIVTFRESQIPQFEAEMLQKIEELLKKKFRLVDKVRDKTQMGFLVENQRVTGIGLFNCRLYILPESIGELTSLKELWLGQNNLRSIPKTLGNLSSLIELDLSNNEILELPESIGNLSSLENLLLLNNELLDLPKTIVNLTSLKNLDLSDNLLRSLPESIGNLISLQNLKLAKNKLIIIPESISNLKSLTYLDLKLNQIKILPESIGELTSLKELYLYNNNLTSLPESIGDLPSLQKIDLTYNDLTILPQSIGNLTSFENLSLYENNLMTLPESIGNLTSLQELRLDRNQLTTLPESIGNLTSLQELYLEDNLLTTLPESIGNLTSLQKLRLDRNQLTTLPKSIGKLKSIQLLYLIENNLTTLPESIGNLKSLERLHLDFNDLTTLPDSMGDLSSLKEIRLFKNKLTTLPDSIKNLSSLKELYLLNNKLTSLPESIGDLSSLQQIDLRNNDLTILPESIGNLKSLWTLNLENNQLDGLPESIVNLKSLQALYLRGNQLANLSEKVIRILRGSDVRIEGISY